MNKEQYKQAREVLGKIDRLEKERDTFIIGLDNSETYFTALDKHVVDSIMKLATDNYNTKLDALKKEFENL